VGGGFSEAGERFLPAVEMTGKEGGVVARGAIGRREGAGVLGRHEVQRLPGQGIIWFKQVDWANVTPGLR